MSQEYKFGFNADIGTTEETVWDLGSIYTYLAAATVLKVSSSDADDDAAGTGARTVQVFGLGSGYAPINEVVILDGQTAVTTINEYLRVFRLMVRSAGSGGQNAGTIYAGTGTVTGGVPANKYAAISPGLNQTLMCVWTVPSGERAYLKHLMLVSQGNATANAACRLVARPVGEVFQTKEYFTVFRNSISVPHKEVSTEYSEKTDIEIRAKSSTGTIDVSASFSMETQNW